MCAARRTCKLRPTSDFLLEIRRGSQFMRSVGLEPTRLAAQEPKSCMSANFIMTAYIVLFSYSFLTLLSEILRSALTLLLLCSRKYCALLLLYFYSALGNAFEHGLESKETSLDDK